MSPDDRVWPCDRMLCFRRATLIIVTSPPITDQEFEALGLSDLQQVLAQGSPSDATKERLWRALVPAMGQKGGCVEIRCDKHAYVPGKFSAPGWMRLPVPISDYIRLFGFPRMSR